MKDIQIQDIVITRYWIRTDEPNLGYGVYKHHRRIMLSILLIIAFVLVMLITIHGSPFRFVMTAGVSLLSFGISYWLRSRWAGWYTLDNEGHAQRLYSQTVPPDISLAQSMNRQTFIQRKGNASK
jgi:hypothetical protein